MTVAVMQPYLYPYGGYFRLFACADTFVILDDVQFPRRGRVHRCELPTRGASPRWLTLPLARQPRDVRICDLRFASDARAALDARLRRVGSIGCALGPLARRVRDHLFGPLSTPAAFVEAGLHLVADALRLPARMVRSSELAVDSRLRGQARIIAIAESLGAMRYVNAPGGHVLYDVPTFAAHGIELRFLAPYDGRYRFMLPALLEADAAALRDDIVRSAAAIATARVA